MVKVKGLSKKTINRLSKKGIKLNTVDSDQKSGKKEGKPLLQAAPKAVSNEGQVRVITFDRIVLSKKWTSRLNLKQGDALKIRFENESLILKK